VLVTLVLIAVLFLFVFPTRSYLGQQRELGRVRGDLATLREQNALLDQEARRLQDPDEVERIARERFDLVMPGEEAFAVIPAPEPAGDGGPSTGTKGSRPGPDAAGATGSDAG
jgi:cell division protein FtsB